MFKKILIANRGEIACRIIRTAKKLGIHCVAVYSEADANALHVKLADEAHCLGKAASRESYLNIPAIIQAAKKSQAEAIHPGYGFLSENPDFAQSCIDNKIIFIGPSPAAIRAMGSKTNAKAIMQKAKVPIIPGYFGADQSLETLQKEAEKIGYPVMLKAAAGGGGKGMRLVKTAKEFSTALQSAKREALASFADDTMLIEKYFSQCRHIEVQIFADSLGNFVQLFERDCSIQRRHQKVIEEAPSPAIDNTLRQQLGDTAIKAAKAINYENAGTIEFLLDEKNNFYFMEMNTRLQVEHAITEMITGQDLVEWQLRVSAGEKLPLSQKKLQIKGHAIEARIYAEDPEKNFIPSIGKIIYLNTPTENSQVRIDSGIIQGDQISIYYDPLIAKLIVWDQQRKKTLSRLHQALSQFHVVGVSTNIDFLKAIIAQPKFQKGVYHTEFIEAHKNELFIKPRATPIEVILAACLFTLLSQKNIAKQATPEESNSPWSLRDHWRLNVTEEQILSFIDHGKKIIISVMQENNTFHLKINSKKFITTATLNKNHLQAMINKQPLPATVVSHNHKLDIFYQDQHYALDLYDPLSATDETQDITSYNIAPMPGTVVTVLVKPEQIVEKGEALLVIEAMKMEHTVLAPSKGIIKKIYFQPGDLVREGAKLFELE